MELAHIPNEINVFALRMKGNKYEYEGIGIYNVRRQRQWDAGVNSLRCNFPVLKLLYRYYLQILYTSLLHCSFLDFVSFVEHLLGSAEIDIGRCEIVEQLVIALVVVIRHETGNLRFKISRKKIILQVHNIFHRAMITPNFALRHRMIRRGMGVLDVPALQKQL